jgi:hypothetical protein
VRIGPKVGMTMIGGRVVGSVLSEGSVVGVISV